MPRMMLSESARQILEYCNTEAHAGNMAFQKCNKTGREGQRGRGRAIPTLTSIATLRNLQQVLSPLGGKDSTLYICNV